MSVLCSNLRKLVFDKKQNFYLFSKHVDIKEMQYAYKGKNITSIQSDEI